MKLLDEYLEKQNALYEYFGYVEDWVAIPIDDARGYFWRLQGGEGYEVKVCFAESEKELQDTDSDHYYENEIYTQRFLPKWVYRGLEFTMVVVDTRTDGNKFLQIFENSKERPS